MSRMNKRLIENKIDLNNVDRIGLAGDSYTEGMYYIKGKTWACRFSEILDYNIESIGLGGITCSGLATNIKNNTPRFHETLGWQDFKPTKAMLMSYVNDMATLGTSSENFQNGMKELIQTVMSYGAEPIVCTEFRRTWGNGLESGISSMCDDIGVKLWNILDYTEFLGHGNSTDGDPYYAPYWQGSHPGTRTGFIILDQYLREAKSLPRPKQSLKIFRKLPSVVVSDLDDLIYSGNYNRMELFKEIFIGHSALSDATKYDEINTYTTHADVDSEYLKIMAGEAVSFSDYAVVECVLPSTRPNIYKIKLNISDSDATVYIEKEGVWTELLNKETIDLDGCIDYDKVKFLIYKDGGFDISSVSVSWEGEKGKDANVFRDTPPITSGTELLSNNTFTDVTTDRTIIGALESYSTLDGVYPIGLSKIVTVDSDNYFRQSIANTQEHYGVKAKVKLRVVARYNPTEGTTDIDEYSFDWGKLNIKIKGQLSGGTTQTYYSVTKYVGLHWTMLELDIDMPTGTSSQEITIQGVDKSIEVSYISAIKY